MKLEIKKYNKLNYFLVLVIVLVYQRLNNNHKIAEKYIIPLTYHRDNNKHNVGND